MLKYFANMNSLLKEVLISSRTHSEEVWISFAKSRGETDLLVAGKKVFQNQREHNSLLNKKKASFFFKSKRTRFFGE